MVAIAGINFPHLCHLLGNVHIASVEVFSSAHFTHLCIAGNTHDGFDTEVGIMSPVAGEIVGTELRIGILTIVHQVVHPSSTDVPIGVHPIGVALNL